MGPPTATITHLANDEILAATVRAAAVERGATRELIALLAELDTRRLYLGEGCASLFVYCTRVLHLSEHAAYGRIEAARCARRVPAVLELLAEGAVTLTTISLVASHLTPDNAPELLPAVRHRSKREVEQLVATWRPLPPIASSVRRLPAPVAPGTTGQPGGGPKVQPPVAAPALALKADESRGMPHDISQHQTPARRAVVRPLAPNSYKVQFTVTSETHDRLRRAQDLLRHVIPNGDPAAIFDRALTLLLADLERTRLAAVTQPRRSGGATSPSRQVPAGVKRAVWSRDDGQCTFVGAHGRCVERGFLELHHLVPFADGGRTVADNLALRCRAHNAYEAEQWFGPWRAREAGPSYSATRSGPS
ncbi:MAG: HNH endonuclease signature motif containing protein [Vicinamibacterales bacterium]